MRSLGYKYDARRKTYYTDTHNKKSNVRYRIDYCKRYLEEYEPYCLRWFQFEITVLGSAFDKFEGKDHGNLSFAEIQGRGRVYESGTKIEFHIDTIFDLPFIYPHLKSKEVKGFLGNMSIFRNDKSAPPMIILGQDEVICKQYLINLKTLFGPNGEFKLAPKYEG